MGCLSVNNFLCCLSLEAGEKYFWKNFENLLNFLFLGGYICSIFTGIVAGIAFVATIVDLFANMGTHDAGNNTL